MKKFILFSSIITMMGYPSFNKEALASNCKQGCTELEIYYHGKREGGKWNFLLLPDTVDANYRDCESGHWASHGVWGIVKVDGVIKGPYPYCVKPGTDDIVIRKLSSLATVVLRIPQKDTSKPKITVDCYFPDQNSVSGVTCTPHF